jgi:hypothetical protein
VEAGDVVQTVGLVVNAGLLVAVAYELRTAAVTRRQDIDSSRRQATLDTWRSISVELTDAEASLWHALGRLRMTTDDARRIFGAQARQRREPMSESDDGHADIEALEAYESIRTILNALDNYAVGIDVGAYDYETAYRISGWRVARTYDRRYENNHRILARFDLGRARASISVAPSIRPRVPW